MWCRRLNGGGSSKWWNSSLWLGILWADVFVIVSVACINWLVSFTKDFSFIFRQVSDVHQLVLCTNSFKSVIEIILLLHLCQESSWISSYFLRLIEQFSVIVSSSYQYVCSLDNVVWVISYELAWGWSYLPGFIK